MLYRRWRGFRNEMNLRWRLAGVANKPPCGAVAKSHGVEQTRERLINGSGMNNGDERKWTPSSSGYTQKFAEASALLYGIYTAIVSANLQLALFSKGFAISFWHHWIIQSQVVWKFSSIAPLPAMARGFLLKKNYSLFFLNIRLWKNISIFVVNY